MFLNDYKDVPFEALTYLTGISARMGALQPRLVLLLLLRHLRRTCSGRLSRTNAVTRPDDVFKKKEIKI